MEAKGPREVKAAEKITVSLSLSPSLPSLFLRKFVISGCTLAILVSVSSSFLPLILEQ